MVFTLYIKVIESNDPLRPVIKFETKHSDILKIIGAANTAMSHIAITQSNAFVNDFGEIERDNKCMRLKPCIWQYVEKYDAYIGIVELNDDEEDIHVLCVLKGKQNEYR